jgi:hypothetical protein
VQATINEYQTMVLPANVASTSSEYCVRFPKYKISRTLFDCIRSQVFFAKNPSAQNKENVQTKDHAFFLPPVR